MAEKRGGLYFPWSLLDIVLRGYSALDLSRLSIHTMEQATQFIRAYGLDLCNSYHADFLWGVHQEAVEFIEECLLPREGIEVPEHLKNRQLLKDLRRLLVYASDPSQDPYRKWACALLKVMHVIIHLHCDPRVKVFELARRQIFERIDRHVHVDYEKGAVYLGEPEGEEDFVELVYFKKKDKKDRYREIIKLLHKKDSAAEEIYDRLGFRFVTKTPLDSLQVLKILIRKNIISLPNICPGRTKNWLIDLTRTKVEVTRLRKLLAARTKSKRPFNLEAWFRRVNRSILQKEKRSLLNPFSDKKYRAIQLTCRELVIYGGGSEESGPGWRNEPLVPVLEMLFVPYEIQILDVASYTDSIFGEANHEKYQLKQLQMARRRVFGVSPPF